MQPEFDVIVVGAGMVGAATACGLTDQGHRVALIEPQVPEPIPTDAPPDLRVSAISTASERLLRDLDAWASLPADRLCPYRRLAVWERANARTDFDASQISVSHLGHIIENRVVQLGLHQALQGRDDLTWFKSGFNALHQSGEQATVTLDDGSKVSAYLVVGADGANSKVRQGAGIGTTGWQYRQHALAIGIQCQQQQDITWQQFCPTGPRAYLPLFNGYGSLVWYDAPETVKQLKQLNASQLKQAVIEAFPDELADFEIIDTASFPLTRMHADHYHRDRVVILGDAAHTINPLAGQGVNLGFKDVKVLVECLAQTTLSDIEELDHSLTRFSRRRRPDNALMMTAMDSFYKMFSNDLTLMKALRNAALSLADRSGPIKNQVMRYAMGL